MDVVILLKGNRCGSSRKMVEVCRVSELIIRKAFNKLSTRYEDLCASPREQIAMGYNKYFMIMIQRILIGRHFGNCSLISA